MLQFEFARIMKHREGGVAHACETAPSALAHFKGNDNALSQTQTHTHTDRQTDRHTHTHTCALVVPQTTIQSFKDIEAAIEPSATPAPDLE